MARFFYKCLGRFALMTAAALWAGCGNDDANKKEHAKEESLKVVSPSSSPKKEIADSKYLPNRKNIKGDSTLRLQLDSIKSTREEIESVGLLYGAAMVSQISGKRMGRVRTVKETDLEIDGSLSGETFLKIIRQRTPGLRHIYNKFLKKKCGSTENICFSGEVILGLTIPPDGKVSDVIVKSSTTGYGEFDEEIKTAVNRWRFVESSGKTTVTVPFVFSELSEK